MCIFFIYDEFCVRSLMKNVSILVFHVTCSLKIWWVQCLEHVRIQHPCLIDNLCDIIQHVLQIGRRDVQCQSMSMKNVVTGDHIWVHHFDERHEPRIFFLRWLEYHQYQYSFYKIPWKVRIKKFVNHYWNVCCFFQSFMSASWFLFSCMYWAKTKIQHHYCQYCVL